MRRFLERQEGRDNREPYVLWSPFRSLSGNFGTKNIGGCSGDKHTLTERNGGIVCINAGGGK